LARLLICLSLAMSAAAQGGSSRFLAPAGKSIGQQCGTAYYGYQYGDCADGLRCVPPAAGSPLGSPSICQKQCGFFDAKGNHVDESINCGLARECSGRAAVRTPCQGGSDGACYMYCAYSSRQGQNCGISPTSGNDYGECGPGYACVAPTAGSPPDAASTCQKA